MSKKKILYLLSSNKYSGAENVICTIIDNIKNKYECAYCSPTGPISTSLEDRNITFFPLKKLSYFELKRVINNYHPDIIHANDYKASCIAALFSYKAKIISQIHGNNEKMREINIKSLLFSFLSKKISRIIWVSDSCFEDYVYKNKLSAKSSVLYNVVDEKVIKRKSNIKKIENKYDLIYLGRLSLEKDPIRTVEIVNIIKQVKKDISCAIVGDGILKSEVEQKIKEYNLEKNVTLFGFVDNPYPILKNSKILIMSSRWEGMPMVALEAQAFGMPIVSTPVDGLKKIVKNDINGYLSDDNNVLSEKIITYLTVEEYTKMSQRTSEMFKNQNSITNYIDTIDKIYREVLK